MAELLKRTEATLEDCRDHLSAVQRASPEIDTSAVSAYLATHVAIVLCAEVETTLRSFFVEVVEASDCADRVKQWAMPRQGDVRNATYRGVVELLEWRLDREAARTFDDLARGLGVDDEAKSRLGIVVKARNDTSHATGATITIDEVARAADAADLMLTAARTAMGLSGST